MLQLPQVKCVMMNAGVKSCTTAKCNQPAIVCSSPHCECINQHRDCLNFTQIQTVLSKLVRKDESGKKPFQILIDCCDYVLKQFAIQKSAIQESLNSGGGLQNPQQIKFYKAIKANRKIDMSGDAVSRVIQSLIEQPVIDTQQTEMFVSGIANGYKQYIDNIIKNMVSVIKDQCKKDLSFTAPREETREVKKTIQKLNSLKQSHDVEKHAVHPIQKIISSTPTPNRGNPVDFTLTSKYKCKKIQVKGSRIYYDEEKVADFSSLISKIVSLKDTKSNPFILIQPSLNSLDGSEVSIEFKVISNKVYFGVSFKQILEECQYFCSVGDRYQGYSINCYGYTFSTVPEDNEKKTPFDGFSDGDKILLTYSSKYKKFRIINRTKNKEHVMMTPNHFNRTLYFSVGFGDGGEVEFRGVYNVTKNDHLAV